MERTIKSRGRDWVREVGLRVAKSSYIVWRNTWNSIHRGTDWEAEGG